MSDPQPDLARPSFAGYWKRSKDEQATQNLTFVSSKLGQPSDQGENDAQTEPQSEAKTKARRQQVRNAQRQHRQRKANYTKQLEMDVTKLRDDIARVEEELEALRRQNGVVRSQLAAQENAARAVDVSPSANIMMNHMAFSTSLAPKYTVSLDMSEDLGTPAYQISRPSSSLPDTSSNSIATYSHAPETVSGTTPASTVGTSVEDVAVMESMLSEEQIDRVINFILALEHCCWNHIPQTCFEHHHHQHCPQEPHPEEMCMNKGLNGHTLMATTLALQSAPYSIFEHMSEFPSTHPSSVAGEDHQLAWSTRALTLTNLRRLARTLNPFDAELAPVQAWFELASLYGIDRATDAAVLSQIRHELVGKVRCVVYGAAVKRTVFEDVLKKVIGFLPRSRAAGTGVAYTGDEGEDEEDMDVMMMMMEMGDEDDGEDYNDGMMGMMRMNMKKGMGMGRGREMEIGQGGEEDMNARVSSPQGN
ncbi:hypothetical protein RRF57_005619 [Xylaria bambusicola]|uniref:Putative transcription factor kapC n=1 Tax=Xylaria bambusicola TaxID=326684 RepID=A0AAN7UMI2_9PEZI